MRNNVKTLILIIILGFICSVIYFLARFLNTEIIGIFNNTDGFLLGLWIATIILPLLLCLTVKTGKEANVLLLVLNINLLFSYDMAVYAFPGFNYSVFAIFSYFPLSIIIFFVIIYSFAKSTSVHLSRHSIVILLSISIMGLLLFFLTSENAKIFSFIAVFLLCSYTFYMMIKVKSRGWTIYFYITLNIIVAANCFKEIVFAGKSALPITILLLMLADILILIEYFTKVRDKYINSIKVAEMDKHLNLILFLMRLQVYKDSIPKILTRLMRH